MISKRAVIYIATVALIQWMEYCDHIRTDQIEFTDWMAYFHYCS